MFVCSYVYFDKSTFFYSDHEEDDFAFEDDDEQGKVKKGLYYVKIQCMSFISYSVTFIL